jgi:sporulation protein YlmC with PRC-barrel domain
MAAMRISLDSFKGKPVYLGKTHREFGFVDDVIINPRFGILAVVSHHSRWGTWAFAYVDTHIARDAITVAGHGRQSPRVFLRKGRSYQDMIGGKVLDSDGSAVGRIKDIELVDLLTGEIAYHIRRGGLRGLWAPEFSVHAPTGVVTADARSIVLSTRMGPSARKKEETRNSNRKQAA